MATIFGRHIPGTKKVPIPKLGAASKEVGGSGTAVFGGYVQTNETNPILSDGNRYNTAADILANISVVAASVRYFLNLVANPAWMVEPADDSPAAEEAAEFVKTVMDDLSTSWTSVVRRSGLYKFHGFSIQEWTAKKRDDGLIGLESIEARPQHTIHRWDVNDNGSVLGVWQRLPQTGLEVSISRWKFVYLLDDTLTDSPTGMGWFRHLVEPSTRLKEYLSLEKVGFERDLAGVPVGKAPITAINKAVKQGALSKIEADAMLTGIKNFVKLELKKSTTGMVLDSQTFEDQTADGTKHSGVAQWGVDLLTGEAGSIQQLGTAIERINIEMARIIGTENIFTGANSSGSLALSKDKSSNLYLNINSTLDEMTEQFSKDIIGGLWALNGFDDKLKPKFKHEDVSFKDAEQMALVLRDLAGAGAILAPNDPAIDDLRVLLGLPLQDLTGFDDEPGKDESVPSKDRDRGDRRKD